MFLTSFNQDFYTAFPWIYVPLFRVPIDAKWLSWYMGMNVTLIYWLSLQLRENPGEILNQKLTHPRTEPRSTGRKAGIGVMYSMRSREYDIPGAASTSPPPSMPSPTERSGANSPSVFTSKHVSVKAGKETYISRIVGGKVFLCTRWQCKMFVVLDSSKSHSQMEHQVTLWYCTL